MLKGMFTPHRRKKTLWTTAAVLAVLVLAISAAFFFKQYRDIKKTPEVQAKATSQRIVDKVGSLYFLPTGETPTVAKIEDKSKLGDQPFFKDADNGDYLLVYAQAKVALIYRETQNKLVNVGPVNTDDKTQPDQNNGVAGEQTKKP